MNPIRKAALGGALVFSTLAGGALGAAMLGGSANAQTGTPTTTPAATAESAPPAGAAAHDPSQGGHTANGITEALLTGDTATQVTTAAQAAVPGGTIERVENDAEGAAYEAHVVKADGTHVTVKLDSSFKVTTVEEGGPRGG